MYSAPHLDRSRLARQRPKLEGACQVMPMLDVTWRHEAGHTSPRNVTTWVEGLIFLDVVACAGQLWPLIEVSADAKRWADRVTWPAIHEAGYYAIPVTNLGAFLRVSYQIDGRVKFGIEWLGKAFAIGRPAGGL